MDGDSRDEGSALGIIGLLVAVLLIGGGALAFWTFRVRAERQRTAEEAILRAERAAAEAARAREEAKRREAESEAPEPTPK